MLRFTPLLVLALIVSPLASAAEFVPSTRGKKLISYGSDWPNTVYVRQHVREMEKQPFDGIVIGLSETREPQTSGETLGVRCWTKQKFDPKFFEPALEDLKAIKFENFKDNFVQVETMPGDVDWFDDDQFGAVVHNFKILARIAHEGGCVGLEFDPEEYGDQHLFSYIAWDEAKRKGRTEQQYVEKVRQRGSELMKAINGEFPKIKILCLFGPTLSAHERRATGPGHGGYGLLAPFLEGMCRAADEGSQIIDGYEQSYGYKVPLSFAEGRKNILASRETFDDKSAFDRVMRVGFGLWIDNDSGHRGWFPNEPEKNHFQPETWQNAVNGALSYSDEYVWVWREQVRLWEGKNVSPAYQTAQEAGRTSPAKVEVKQKPVSDATRKRLGATGPRDDATTFEDLLETHDVLADLSTSGWEFSPDPDQMGLDAQRTWSPIEVEKFWEEQGWDYDGVAWYRRMVNISKMPAGKVELVVGACDESAEVFLNGEKVGEHGDGEYGWDERFSIDLTGKLKPGDNAIAIRVTDRTGPGGLWKGVKILAEKPNPFIASTKGKKLIEYGWDAPDTAYVRDHAGEMEKRPFDGVVIRATFPPTESGKRADSMGWRVFSKKRFESGQYEHNIEILKDAKFQKFTDNFIQVISQPGDVDWFEPEWSSVLENIRVMARIAKQGGCVGLMFDPEEYGKNKIWTYAAIPEDQRHGRTLDQYAAKVRQRGAEFIRAINSEFPKVKILCLFGPALTYSQQRVDRGGYSLLAPFIEGMCAAADEGTQITDGFEQSYMYRAKTSFVEGRKDILGARKTFANSAAFDRVMRVGFGLWADNDSNGKKGRPWSPTNFAQNYFQPDTWQSAIYYGLSYSDEYVWVYSEAFDWWTGKNVGEAYEAAQRAGRDAPSHREVARREPTPAEAKFIKHASGRGDAKALAKVMANREVRLDLTGGPWMFRLDPDNVGVAEKWFNKDIDTASWSPIEVGKFWEEQGWDYDGYGWYRMLVNLPAAPAGKRVELLIGAADERALVWVNGVRVGAHDVGENGWDQPFTLDVTDALKTGQNLIVVRVLDLAGPGGLWGSVKLLTDK